MSGGRRALDRLRRDDAITEEEFEQCTSLLDDGDEGIGAALRAAGRGDARAVRQYLDSLGSGGKRRRVDGASDAGESSARRGRQQLGEDGEMEDEMGGSGAPVGVYADYGGEDDGDDDDDEGFDEKKSRRRQRKRKVQSTAPPREESEGRGADGTFVPLALRRKAPRKWTAEEDQALRDAVEQHGARSWKQIATMVPGRSHVQCLQRWRKVLAPGLVKGAWTEHEDAALMSVVEHGFKNWGEVASKIDGRTAKQCRERWYNHLDPDIKKSPWTPEEDEALLRVYEDVGHSWAAIARMLPGRTENAVKVRWKTLSRTGATARVVGREPRSVPRAPPRRGRRSSARRSRRLDDDDEEYEEGRRGRRRNPSAAAASAAAAAAAAAAARQRELEEVHLLEPEYIPQSHSRSRASSRAAAATASAQAARQVQVGSAPAVPVPVGQSSSSSSSSQQVQPSYAAHTHPHSSQQNANPPASSPWAESSIPGMTPGGLRRSSRRKRRRHSVFSITEDAQSTGSGEEWGAVGALPDLQLPTGHLRAQQDPTGVGTTGHGANSRPNPSPPGPLPHGVSVGHNRGEGTEATAVGGLQALSRRRQRSGTADLSDPGGLFSEMGLDDSLQRLDPQSRQTLQMALRKMEDVRHHGGDETAANFQHVVPSMNLEMVAASLGLSISPLGGPHMTTGSPYFPASTRLMGQSGSHSPDMTLGAAATKPAHPPGSSALHGRSAGGLEKSFDTHKAPSQAIQQSSFALADSPTPSAARRRKQSIGGGTIRDDASATSGGLELVADVATFLGQPEHSNHSASHPAQSPPLGPVAAELRVSPQHDDGREQQHQHQQQNTGRGGGRPRATSVSAYLLDTSSRARSRAASQTTEQLEN